MQNSTFCHSVWANNNIKAVYTFLRHSDISWTKFYSPRRRYFEVQKEKDVPDRPSRWLPNDISKQQEM
jgi:hypothetical protein